MSMMPSSSAVSIGTTTDYELGRHMNQLTALQRTLDTAVQSDAALGTLVHSVEKLGHRLHTDMDADKGAMAAIDVIQKITELARALGHEVTKDETPSGTATPDRQRFAQQYVIVLAAVAGAEEDHVQKMAEQTAFADQHLYFATEDAATIEFPWASESCNIDRCTTGEGKHLQAVQICYNDIIVKKSGRQWCLVGDADTYFVLNRLDAFLRHYNASDPYYLGCDPMDAGFGERVVSVPWASTLVDLNADCPVAKTSGNPEAQYLWKRSHNGTMPPHFVAKPNYADMIYKSASFGYGGKGHIISKGALLKLGDQINTCVESHLCGAMDIRVGQCLNHFGIKLTPLQTLPSEVSCRFFGTGFEESPNEYSSKIDNIGLSYHKVDWGCLSTFESVLYNDNAINARSVCCGWRAAVKPMSRAHIALLQFEGSRDDCVDTCIARDPGITITGATLAALYQPSGELIEQHCLCWQAGVIKFFDILPPDDWHNGKTQQVWTIKLCGALAAKYSKSSIPLHKKIFESFRSRTKSYALS